MEPSRRRTSSAPAPTRGCRAHARAVAVVLGVLLGTVTACSGGDPEPSAEAAASPSGSATPAATSGRWPDLPGTGLPADVADRLEAEMSSWVEREMLPGVTAAVASPQGVWVGAAGVDAAGTPLTPDAGLSLLHVTWSFTAAEVMLLAERGEVDLDAPASTYVDVPQVANGATVRQLLEHRAGITDPGWEVYEEAMLSRPDEHWSTKRFLAPVPEATDPPGQRTYVDITNYELLGLVVEEVTGEDLASALRADLWAPVGLTRLALQDAQRLPPPLTVPGEDDQLPANIADGRYLPFRSIASAMRASVGAAGDAESAARWGYALYGSHVLTPESVAEMTDFDSDGDDVGLGTFNCTTRVLESPTTDCVGTWGKVMGYSAVLAVVPSAQTSVVVLTPSTADAYGFVKWLVSAGNLLGNAPTT